MVLSLAYKLSVARWQHTRIKRSRWQAACCTSQSALCTGPAHLAHKPIIHNTRLAQRGAAATQLLHLGVELGTGLAAAHLASTRAAPAIAAHARSSQTSSPGTIPANAASRRIGVGCVIVTRMLLQEVVLRPAHRSIAHLTKIYLIQVREHPRCMIEELTSEVVWAQLAMVGLQARQRPQRIRDVLLVHVAGFSGSCCMQCRMQSLATCDASSSQRPQGVAHVLSVCISCTALCRLQQLIPQAAGDGHFGSSQRPQGVAHVLSVCISCTALCRLQQLITQAAGDGHFGGCQSPEDVRHFLRLGHRCHTLRCLQQLITATCL